MRQYVKVENRLFQGEFNEGDLLLTQEFMFHKILI
jgi:hypothetical protein